MEISVTPDWEEYVANKVASGCFTSPSEVFVAGLEALRAEEQDMEQWLINEVVPALEELEADPSLAIPIDEVFAEIREFHTARRQP